MLRLDGGRKGGTLLAQQCWKKHNKQCLPGVEYPSCLQTTWASTDDHPSPFTVPHLWSRHTSTRPSLSVSPPTSRTSPSTQGTAWHKKTFSNDSYEYWISCLVYLGSMWHWCHWSDQWRGKLYSHNPIVFSQSLSNWHYSWTLGQCH